MKYKRVLLKLSGEALPALLDPSPQDQETMHRVADEIRHANEGGVEIAIVVGGGNIFRGTNGVKRGMEETVADQIGMLATIQNGLLFQELLERRCKLKTRLMSGMRVNSCAEEYIVRRAVRHLEKGRVVILAGGTGNGGCTTDYAAALRAKEVRAGVVAKATNVDGVYDRDPKQPDARLFMNVSYDKCIRDDLKVMDTAAFALCRDHNIPIRVFALDKPGNIRGVLSGENIGTYVSTAGDADATS